MSAIRVCPIKDIECGPWPEHWCAECPNQAPTLQDQLNALEARVSALEGKRRVDWNYGDPVPKRKP